MKNYIGNDIVDLTTADAINFPSSSRFVKRVLAEDELQFFQLHGSPVTLFWIHWSAKEAVYKVVKKITPDSVFSHQAYVLTLEKLTDDSANGLVTYLGQKYKVAFSITEKLVHCIATPIDASGHIISEVKMMDKISRLDNSFTNQELASVHSGESFLVRCLLKNMLKDITGNEYQIYRPSLQKKFGPPEVWMEGQKCDSLDISMSHDGDYCAGLILFNRLESCQ